MSDELYDLAVWPVDGPITEAQARAVYEGMASGRVPVVRPDTAAVLAEKLAALVAEVGGELHTFAAGAYLSVPPRALPELGPQLATLADELGCAVYDPQAEAVRLPATGDAGWRHRATLGEDVVLAYDPDADELRALVRWATAGDGFLILERADGEFIQTACDAAGRPGAGRWVLEHRDASGRHVHAVDLDESTVVEVFVRFAAGEPGWSEGLTLTAVDLG